MKHRDEQTPIHDRWSERAVGDGDEAKAGALFRAATQHGPVTEKRLAEIHSRLRRSRRKMPAVRPALRVLRHAAFVAGFVLCGGVLAATVAHVLRRPTAAPAGSPSPTVEKTAKPGRHSSRARGPVAPELQPAPETEAPAPAPAVVTIPEAPAPVTPPTAAPHAASATNIPRAPSPPRRLALREAPRPAPAAFPVESPLPVHPSPAPTPTEITTPTTPTFHIERPVPTMVPAPAAPLTLPSAKAPAPREPSRLARESRWLASAIAKLRQDRQPGEALAILDQHQVDLSTGVLAVEANATRIEALLRLGRNGQALALLDGQRLSAQGLGREMLVARGELRAEKGRLGAAIQDFDQVLSSTVLSDGLAERALYGRGMCRAKSGQRDGAKNDLTRYLSAFPQGRFVEQARSALSQ